MKTNRELVKVQQMCLNAMERILPEFVRVWSKIEDLELYTDIEISVLPWNNGYEVKVNKKMNWNFTKNKDEKILNILGKLEMNISNFYIQPCSFFESALRTKEAYLEGCSLNLNKDYDSFISDKFDDICYAQMAIDEYVSRAIKELRYVWDVLDSLNL